MARLVTKMSCVARSTSSGCVPMAKAAAMAAPPEVPPMMSNVEAGLDQRLVEADVRRAVGAAAAGDEAERRAVDEAVEPLDIAALSSATWWCMAIWRAPASAPCRDTAPRVVQQHEALRVGRQQLGGQLLQRIGPLVGRMPADGEHQVGLPDGLLRPGRQLRARRRTAGSRSGLERVERARRFGAVEWARRRAAPSRAISGRIEHDAVAGVAGTRAPGRRRTAGQLRCRRRGSARWCAGADRAAARA